MPVWTGGQCVHGLGGSRFSPWVPLGSAGMCPRTMRILLGGGRFSSWVPLGSGLRWGCCLVGDPCGAAFAAPLCFLRSCHDGHRMCNDRRCGTAASGEAALQECDAKPRFPSKGSGDVGIRTVSGWAGRHPGPAAALSGCCWRSGSPWGSGTSVPGR